MYKAETVTSLMCDTNMTQVLNSFNFEMNCRFCLKSDPGDLVSILKHLEISYNDNQSINLEYIILVSTFRIGKASPLITSFFRHALELVYTAMMIYQNGYVRNALNN